MKLLKNILILLPVFIVSSFITGCVSVYQPNPVNAPLLEIEGDIKASLVLQDGLHLQSAAAVSKNIAVMFNAGYDFKSYDRNGRDEESKEHVLFEGGVGFFDKLAENWIWEIYSGYGIGSFKVKREEDHFFGGFLADANGSIGRFFIQPSIAYSSENFVAAFSLRTCYVSILKYETKSDLRLSRYGYFYEPALTLKFGGEKFKVVTQLGISMPRSNSVLTGWEPEPFFGGIGFEINIGKLISNK